MGASTEVIELSWKFLDTTFTEVTKLSSVVLPPLFTLTLTLTLTLTSI